MKYSTYLYANQKLKVMLVKELKKVLEGLDDEKDIEIAICEYDRVDSRSKVILEVGDYGELGYVLELEGNSGLDDGDVDEEDFDDIS
jgi:hypothetical protein